MNCAVGEEFWTKSKRAFHNLGDITEKLLPYVVVVSLKISQNKLRDDDLRVGVDL